MERWTSSILNNNRAINQLKHKKKDCFQRIFQGFDNISIGALDEVNILIAKPLI